MRKKARIFSPDEVKTQISQAITRDLPFSNQEYEKGYDPLVTLRYRVVREFDKKYLSLSDNDESRKIHAYLKFLFVNKHMADIESQFAAPTGLSRPQSGDSELDRILKRAKMLMHSVLSPLSEDEWFYACKHGTGTSLGVSYKDTSLEAKSKLPITLTERVVPLLKRYLDFDSQLKSAIISYNERAPFGEWYTIVGGSRATTVPKTHDIDRMIAVEPTGNMYFQQGLMRCMYDRMKRVGLDLASLPDEHRLRAQWSSITSKEATIDWSSASDCVSRELLRWLLPPYWFDCIDQVRSPMMLIENELVELQMFSTMGNAVTFPLETLVFWTLAHSVRLEKMGTLSSFPDWEELNSVSVFGDDCIVPSDIASTFIRVCEQVGFIVNKEKSFFGDERFRESCGGDYLRGYDVRPFNLKAPTSNRWSALEPWLYIIANRLIPKYMSCFGQRDYVYNKELFRTLFRLFEENGFLVKIVPNDYPDDAGLKISDDLERFHVCYRMKLSRITVDQHGCHYFNYLRYRYREKEKKFGDLRFWQWLKNHCEDLDGEQRKRQGCLQAGSRLLGYGPFPDQLPETPWYHTRKRGGYVVARGKTAHWVVPKLFQV